MPQAFFCIPGDLSLPTGGYAYDRRLFELAEKYGIDLHHRALPGGYPTPSPADLAQTARLIAKTPADAILLIDGLAYGAMPTNLIHGFKRRIVALVHHPLGLENGIGEDRARELIASEIAALALAEKIIVTSPLTARTLAKDFAVPQGKLVVAEPGTNAAPRAVGSGERSVHILAVGALSPRKGYDLLLEALAPLSDESWRLTIAGATDRSPQTFESLTRLIAARGLRDRIVLAGAVSDEALGELYASADLFALSSHYEGYGMALAEAMARGLAVVTTTGGAAADTAPDGATLKVPPGDIAALRAALGSALRDPGLRRRLSDASWAAGQKLPRWDDTARRIATTLKEMMTG